MDITESGMIAVLSKYGAQRELQRYYEPHRYYHNLEHIKAMLYSAKQQRILDEELYLAILFHDIIYNPKNDDNESRSAELSWKYLENEAIRSAILDTKHHESNSSLSRVLISLDLEILQTDLNGFIDFEKKIFKEYQWVDFDTYKLARMKVLQKLKVSSDKINFVQNHMPNIAVYAGSFNPFHVGHYNILQKAEAIFDKVIIARGVNPDKQNEHHLLPRKIQFRQIENYDGMLHNFIGNLNYPVTLIRGIRNESDLRSEITQYRYLQDLTNNNIKQVNIFCDAEFEHVSSSAIRTLKKLGQTTELYEL